MSMYSRSSMIQKVITSHLHSQSWIVSKCNYSRHFDGKKINYYDVLRVGQNATTTEIKSAYYDLSMSYHPDKNPGAEAVAKFQLINEAYETLGNYDRKRSYDRGFFSGKDWNRGEHRKRPSHQPPGMDNYDDSFNKNESTTSDDYDYTQFYKRRQEQNAAMYGSSRKLETIRREPGFATRVGNAEQFNYDEFFKAHYTRSNTNVSFRKYRQKKVEDEENARNAHEVSYGVLACLVMMGIFGMYEGSGYLYVPQKILNDSKDTPVELDESGNRKVK